MILSNILKLELEKVFGKDWNKNNNLGMMFL